MGDDIQARLQAYCALAFPAWQAVQVSSVTSMPGGWECDTYSFDVEHGPVGERRRDGLIVRLYPGDDAHTWAADEFRDMQRLHAAGYPVPRVLLLEGESSPLGQPFVIMERVEGQALWRPLVDSSGGRQQELLTLFCGLLVQLHRLDWRLFVDDVAGYETRGPYAFVDGWLQEAWSILEGVCVRDWSPIVDWLQERRDAVPCPRPVVTHGDFHPQNVLLRVDGSAVVIDWSGLDVTDARFDLARALVLVDAYEDGDWRQRILREYERLAGTWVAQIEWFEVCVGASWLYNLTRYLSGDVRDWRPRPQAEAQIKGDVQAHRRIYEALVQRTGIRIAEVEVQLASLA